MFHAEFHIGQFSRFSNRRSHTEATPGKAVSKESILELSKTERKTPVQRRSACAAFAEIIGPKIEVGLSAQRIYQDLVLEAGFGASYQSVKRYVGERKAADPKRIWRIETEPGEEVQVDFGLGAMIDGEGVRRRTWVLRMVLSHSRKGYSEAVLRQNTESFLRALENGLRAFGGVPQVLNVDNLKAAVVKADRWDPEINPKMADFCRHYGMYVMPCRPVTPQHKGKGERGVANAAKCAQRPPICVSGGRERTPPAVVVVLQAVAFPMAELYVSLSGTPSVTGGLKTG